MYPLINIANFCEFCKIFVLTSWVQVVQKKTLYFPVVYEMFFLIKGVSTVYYFVYLCGWVDVFIFHMWSVALKKEYEYGYIGRNKNIYFMIDSTNIEENLLRQAVPYDIRQLMYTCNTWKDALIPASMMWLIRVMDLPALKMSYMHVIHHKRSPFFQICYFPWGGREGGVKAC